MEAVDTSPIAPHRPGEPFTDDLEDVTSTLPPDRFLDRELSWLNFNNRVLDLAKDKLRVPLLERAKFLAIFASNLDELYMVRVAGLKRRIAAGVAVPRSAGCCPGMCTMRSSTGPENWLRSTLVSSPKTSGPSS